MLTFISNEILTLILKNNEEQWNQNWHSVGLDSWCLYTTTENNNVILFESTLLLNEKYLQLYLHIAYSSQVSL